MRRSARVRRDPITPEEARAAQDYAQREGTAEAFEVAADAWEEAGSLKQADRMRSRANELAVAAAAQQLDRKLQSVALSYGVPEYGQIEPKGDFWISDDDPTKRGRSVRIPLPFEAKPPFERQMFFRGYVEKGLAGWGSGYRFEPWRGLAAEVTEFAPERSSRPILDALANIYRSAIEDSLRKRGRRR